MTEGDTKTLVATVLFKNAVSKRVTLLSTSRNIVTVNDNSKLTAIAEGTEQL